MKEGETIRYRCYECQVVFDLCLAPESEWPEIQEHEIGLMLLVCVERVVAARDVNGPVAERLDGRAQELRERKIVLNDEDRAGRGHGGPP